MSCNASSENLGAVLTKYLIEQVRGLTVFTWKVLVISKWVSIFSLERCCMQASVRRLQPLRLSLVNFVGRSSPTSSGEQGD